MPTDAELIARVLERDDRHAFSQLVRRHQSGVRLLLRRLCCGDEALADDLAQESFIQAYRKLSTYRGGGKLSAWLYRIAYNRFLSDRRRPREQPASEALEESHVELRPAAPSMVGSVHARHDLERAMRVLSEGERAVLALSYGLEASHAEIAGVLKIPLGTVKTQLSRGKEKLRREILDRSHLEERP